MKLPSEGMLLESVYDRQNIIFKTDVFHDG